jgi:hypothetical protein
MIDGNEILEEALHHLGIDLSVLIASVAIWANPEVFNILKNENGLGVYYPKVRRFKAGQGENKGQIINGIRLDDNTYANFAIKKSIGHDREAFHFTTSHIWPDSCYDHRYHTCIANIVLIPKSISGLSDHDQHVIQCLKYRSFELYKWHPIEEQPPTKPLRYPEKWRNPLPMTEAIKRAIQNRG